MENLENMSLEERLERLNRLENRNIEIPIDPISLEEKFYKLERTIPFNFSDYPRLRRHIIDRDTRLYDLPPVVEDRYTTYDDEGAVRDMASSILAKRYRQNRRNRNIRTLKAKDRLDLARIMEANVLPEDIVRNVVKHRNKIDVHNEQFGSSRRRKKKKNKKKKKTRRRQTIHSVEPVESVDPVEQELQPELEYKPESELNLLSLAPDIQETIGENLRNIKLQRLSRENDELMENYKNKVNSNRPFLYYSSLLNTRQEYTNRVLEYNDFSNTTIMNVYKLPSNVANLLIGTIQHFELNNLQELLKFLAEGNNLNEFIFIFTLSLKQSFEYTPIEIQQYINNFLTAINYRFL